MSLKRYTKDFKERLLRELGTGETVAGLGRRYAVSRQLIYEWQQKQRDGALDDTNPVRSAHLNRQIGELEQKVGQLTMENEFLKKTLRRLEQQDPQGNGTASRRSSGKSRKT
jgi:transposase-like protein